MEEDKNYISLIHGDLTSATKVQHGMPDSIGVMSIDTENRMILESSQLTMPVRCRRVSGMRGNCPASLRIPTWASHPCGADSPPYRPDGQCAVSGL